MEKAKKILRTFLGIPITLISFAFIIKVFFDNRTLLSASFSSLNYSLFFIGTSFFMLFFAIKAIIWLVILNKRGHKFPLRATIFRYSLSEIKRYVPGSVFAFVGRMSSHSTDIPQKETLKGIGIEAALMALSAALFSIPGILYFFPYLWWAILIALLATSVGFTVKYPKIVKRYYDCILLYLLAWLAYGIGCLFVATSLTFLPPMHLIPILSIFIISWLGGYLFFVAPMGLGIREIAITGMLSVFIGGPIATTIAVMARVAMTIGELTFLGVTYLFFRMKKNSPISKVSPYFAGVVAASIIYFFAMSYLSMQRHAVLLTGRFDLGNMTQTVWNTSQGRFFTLTNPDGTEIVSRLAVHSDYLLVLFTPFYLLWSDPRVLVIGQALFMAIGGIFVYLLARTIIKNEKISTALALSYLLNFWLHEQTLFDFHAVTFATPFFLAALYFLIRKKYILFAIMVALAATTKENIFLVISFFGFYFMFKEKRWILGILFLIVPFLVFYYLTSVAIPGARGEAHFALGTYSYIGDSPAGIIKNIVTNPAIILGHLLNISTVKYFYYHLLPTGFLALLSPLYLLFTLPEAAIYLLSNNFEYRSYEYHFGAVFLPFIYISTAYAVAFLIKKRQQLATPLFYYILGASFLSFYLYSPLPGLRLSDNRIFEENGSQEILQQLSVIPPDASVTSSNSIGAHLSHRQHIYVIPFAMDSADFIVLHYEKDEILQMVDLRVYDEIVHDEEHSFYIFKRKVFTSNYLTRP